MDTVADSVPSNTQLPQEKMGLPEVNQVQFFLTPALYFLLHFEECVMKDLYVPLLHMFVDPSASLYMHAFSLFCHTLFTEKRLRRNRITGSDISLDSE